MGLILCWEPTLGAEPDPYESYIKNFQRLSASQTRQSMAAQSVPSWLYMPWTYQWSIGYNDESGKWSLANGYNGAFIDWDHIDAGNSKTGRIDWINKFGCTFMWIISPANASYICGMGAFQRTCSIRSTALVSATTPVNDAMRDRLHKLITRHIAAVKSSPMRSAYALDDEISWGHFVHPTMWCVTDDLAAYPSWLKEIYGPNAPQRPAWVTYENIRSKLAGWSVKDFDASPLMDQWTFNDSYWNNFIGDLVEYSNSVDPNTPCGWVGGQSPNAFGGYDYAKIMRKVQFLEAYNIGGSQSIIRSLNPHNAIPTVTSHFSPDGTRHHLADMVLSGTWKPRLYRLGREVVRRCCSKRLAQRSCSASPGRRKKDRPSDECS